MPKPIRLYGLCLGLVISILSNSVMPAQTTQNFPQTLTLEQHTLVLQGTGIRKKLWIKLYRAGFYLPQQTASPHSKTLVASDSATGTQTSTVQANSPVPRYSRMQPQALQTASYLKDLGNEKPMQIRLNILSKLITKDKMLESIDQGFKQSLAGNTETLSREINTFKGFLSREMKKGTIIDIAYLPQQGTTLTQDGSKLGTIKGAAFKKALFGIWLGHSPIDGPLKDKLLGQLKF